jgi:hypothetical protein
MIVQVGREHSMSSLTITNPGQSDSGAVALSMPEAAKLLSREERFMATVAAMNTLLIEKRVYTQQEFDAIFCQWTAAQVSKPKKQRTGWGIRVLSFLGL